MNEDVERFGIVSVGRISQVKRLDLLISAVGKSGVHGAAITLIGPNSESNNLFKTLVDLGAKNKVPLNFLEPVPHAQIGGIILKYSMCYTGSPKTVDKSAIEGALMGCFVLSENVNVLEQTGMNEVWRIIGRTPPTTISEQIQELSIYESRTDLRKVLRRVAIQNNDLNSTAGRIFNQMSNNG
jgi:glycosyltransferase involved in cell wall biosynthesis